MSVKRLLSKKVIIPTAIAAVLGIGALSFPFLQTLYKKHKADNLVAALDKSSKTLETTITDSTNCMSTNSFLMPNKSETDPMHAEIADSQKHLKLVVAQIPKANSLFAAKKYDEVRKLLDSEFGLEEGKTRQTPIGIATRETNELKARTLNPCIKRRAMRDEAISNEWFLKARLKKPYTTRSPERSGDIAELPGNYFQLIPFANSTLDAKLKQLSPVLYNSMGTNLIKHQPVLNHVMQYARSNHVRNKAQLFYDEALRAYSQVRTRNDQLTWYRTKKHDGKLSAQENETLVTKQRRVIGFIKEGDKALENLVNYVKELHTQHLVIVTEHDRDLKKFKHTREVERKDSQGKTYTEDEDYYTRGWEFFYVLTNMTPKGTTSERIRVGEKDGILSSWNYASDEEVGYVRAWKQLHRDNSQIRKGMKLINTNNVFQRLSDDCLKYK